MSSDGNPVTAAARKGRRKGRSDTREAIFAAACRQFAERGYDRTTLRSVAAEAGVDAALVRYFFGTKADLFAHVTTPAFDLAELVATVFTGSSEGVGHRLARFLVTQLEDPDVRARMVGLLRAAASEPEAARMIRETLSQRVLDEVAPAVGLEDAQFRTELIGSQVFGLVMMRYVVELEPLASASPEAVIAAIAPNIQRYLTEPLEPADG